VLVPKQEASDLVEAAKAKGSGCTTVKVPLTGLQLLASVTLYSKSVPASYVNIPVLLVSP
jgi:hypothetical protein